MIFAQSTSVPTSTDRKPATLVSTSGQPCALKETRVVASVAGFVAEVRVEHVFENPHDQALNALYTFPLPHDAAVTAFEFTVDGKARVRHRARARGRPR